MCDPCVITRPYPYTIDNRAHPLDPPIEAVMTEHTKPIKTPSNWSADGMSKGKQTGPVRPTPDAYAPKKK